MKVLELKQILEAIPNDSEILLAVNGHYSFCDTQSRGDAQLSLLEIGGDNVFCFSATNCEFNPAKLNYDELKVIRQIKRHFAP